MKHKKQASGNAAPATRTPKLKQEHTALAARQDAIQSPLISEANVNEPLKSTVNKPLKCAVDDGHEKQEHMVLASPLMS